MRYFGDGDDDYGGGGDVDWIQCNPFFSERGNKEKGLNEALCIEFIHDNAENEIA